MSASRRSRSPVAAPPPVPRTAKPVPWTRKDLLGLEDLDAAEIEMLLDTARGFQEVSTRSIKKVPLLRGKVAVTMFVEPSTRTRTSFELAAQRLSADLLDFSAGSSSLSKGESLVDTGRNIEAMGVDFLVVRHPAAGAPHLLAKHLKASVVNAGDGAHEHPTQGLLDLFTIREAFGRIRGLKVAIVGDIAHSRVARSDIWGLTKLGAEVTVVGPSTLIPGPIVDFGVKVSHDLDAVLPEMDVVNLLRIQMERQTAGLFPSLREYTQLFGLNAARLRRAKPELRILHPGPINRGVEITPEVADGGRSLVLRQVTNGLAVRMAVLYHLNAARSGSAEEGLHV